MMTETSVWYALRTFNCQELALAKFLEERGYSYFIPMTYTTKGRGGVAVPRHLVPAVHNLVFLPKPDDVETFNATLADCKIPVHVFRKLDSKDYYEIPDIEMREFRLLCDPEYEGSQFITLQEAEAKVGVQDGQVVRIMTVHKSKGLEFPVVFAASLEHAWNFRDLSERMLMHKDGLIGVDQIDPDQNTMMSSLPKIIVQQKKKREMLAEEIRLLYVALTRARDRLYMSGTRKKSSDIQGQSISNAGWKIEESELLSCKNSLDLLEAVILHKGNHPFDYDVRTVQPEESEKKPSEEPQHQVVTGDLSEGEKAQLSYAYPYTDLSRIPQLLSVSAIKKEKMGQIEEELQSESTAESLDISDEKLSAADNRQGSVNLSGAERGTLFHNILASADIQLLKEHRVQEILDQLDEYLGTDDNRPKPLD